MKVNQKGFGFVEVIIAIVIIGLIGVIGWLVYDRLANQDSEATNTQTTNESTEANNEEYFVLREWGLRFKVPSGLTDIRYIIHDDTAAFFAKPSDHAVQYTDDYDKYEDGVFKYSIGVLYRSNDSTKTFAGDMTREGKKVGDYYYYTNWAFSSLATGAGCVGLYSDNEIDCNAESKAFDLVNQGDTALLNTIELVQ